jgi:hypothetical protein
MTPRGSLLSESAVSRGCTRPSKMVCTSFHLSLPRRRVPKDDLTLLILSPVHHRGHLRCEYEELGVDEHDQCDVTSGNVQASPARQ